MIALSILPVRLWTSPPNPRSPWGWKGDEMEPRELKAARHKLGYTQKELAELIGKNVHTVSRWENGETEIPKSIEMLLGFMLTQK